MSAFALAAIDTQIEDCRATGHTGNVENLMKARAAVAELIEADETLDACRDEIRRLRERMDNDRPLHPDTPALHRLEAAIKRRATALARVRGAA
ncbi:hypothetical protein BCL79_0651 [Stenotrophomonas rhizophila]|uniref:Uncharacterized protein n=1 Tax=Stenotrophomonas rhizophila TaxID=216778 RepID=A0A498CF59_9GAMM|nr:hypothetical protein [Stenotrophomonas rhizophila]RLK56267.1 hypothetical protein BCL79_0651 [Stenotrophomonas rhizophila]